MPIESTYDRFDPKEYLRNYYTRDRLTGDEIALFSTLIGWLRSLERTFPTAIDIGCGPTLHHSFAVAPFVERLDFADYLPSNREAVHSWFAAKADAHDWTPLFREVHLVDGGEPGELEKRINEYRSKIGEVLHCDLVRRDPYAAPPHFTQFSSLSGRYDLVLSFFCSECVTRDLDEWRLVAGRVLDVVQPGGAVFFAACRDCERYRVLGRWFPVARVTEVDFEELLLARGFDPATVKAEAVPAPEFAEDGFDHIILARGVKRVL